MSLRHLRIPSWPMASPPRFPSYAAVEHLQSELQRNLLSWKSAAPAPGTGDSAESSGAGAAAAAAAAAAPPPLPTLISFTPKPTYTLGRRQTAPLTQSELARLTAPLEVSSSLSSSSPTPSSATSSSSSSFQPAVSNAPRGGLTTYHGPGQVVFWPVIDLRSPLHAHFTVRDYACLLEKTTIATLAKFGIQGFTTENPGVWVRHHGGAAASGGDDDERKVAALGVHLRRHVTGLGVAVNYGMPVTGPETRNPWGRIVACGLGDKGVTSITAELQDSGRPRQENEEEEEGGKRAAIGGEQQQVTGDAIASAWALEFATRLKLVTSSGNTGAAATDSLVRVEELIIEDDVE